ncbi:ABC transporter [bacterium SCGC AG-212-C10]|nr:ABC transporter [bacterium SCGC AG-212-C10]
MRGSNLRWFVADTLQLAGRNLAHIRQVPEKLIDVTVQPLMFVLLFAYVFGGAIDIPGGNYNEYLMAGIFVQTIGFGIVGPATAIATDLSDGIIDRLRSLPINRSAYLFGHVLAEFMASMLALVLMTISGLVVGWRIDSDIYHAVAGYGLLILFMLAMIWTGTLVGLMVRAADAVTGIAFMVIFPLTFIANTFVPVGTLPTVLRVFAEWNPVSAMTQACRQLFGNPSALSGDPAWPMEHPVITSLFWCIGLLAITIPLSIRAYRARTSN